jgi:hypothetical protein
MLLIPFIKIFKKRGSDHINQSLMLMMRVGNTVFGVFLIYGSNCVFVSVRPFVCSSWFVWPTHTVFELELYIFCWMFILILKVCRIPRIFISVKNSQNGRLLSLVIFVHMNRTP